MDNDIVLEELKKLEEKIKRDNYRPKWLIKLVNCFFCQCETNVKTEK